MHKYVYNQIMDLETNEIPSLPDKIDWPQEIDVVDENQIKVGFRNHAAHIPVLNIMNKEKNELNDSLPLVSKDEIIGDMLNNEVIGYGDAIERIKRAFELQDSEKMGIIASDSVDVIAKVEGKLSKSVHYQDTQDEFLAELEHDRKLIEEDPTGFAFVDNLEHGAIVGREARVGYAKGIIEATKRYKALYSVANPHPSWLRKAVPAKP